MRSLALAIDWRRLGRASPLAEKLLRTRASPLFGITSAADGMVAGGVTGAGRADLLSVSAADVLVLAEGRLHDVESLKNELEIDNTDSIARVVGAGYLRWGNEFVTHLRGDYALIIWDGAGQRVLAARDPFGVRPLHYAMGDSQLCIASDVDQLVAAGIVSSAPDEQMVVDFLLRDFRTVRRSFFKDASRVPPGHLLKGTAAAVQTFDYRRPPASQLRFSSVEESREAFRERFFEAVRRRISSETSVIVQLSGGLDSTAILSAAERATATLSDRAPVVRGAFAAFPGLSCDETAYVDEVESQLRIPVSRWNGALADGVEFSEPLVSAPGSRISFSGGTEGYVEIARAHGAQVVLDGTGGDQVGIPLGTESDEPTVADWCMALQHLRGKGSFRSRALPVVRWAAGNVVPGRVRAAYWRARRSLGTPSWLASPAAARGLGDDPRAASSLFASSEQRMRWETLTGAGLAASIDAKQRHAAHWSLEVTFPFLDWDVVQFILALPHRYWPRRRWLARLHREALRAYLPTAVYERRSKAEFTPAMVNRIIRNLDIVRSLLAGPVWEAGRFVDQDGARRLLMKVEHERPIGFAAVYHLWAIASLEAWLRRILSYRTPAS